MKHRFDRFMAQEAYKLLSTPGVNVVKPATRQKGGVDTGQPCISIGVTRKKPLAEIRPEHRIPGKMSGLQMDVIERPVIKALDYKVRPVIGGISGFVADIASSYGTIGGIVIQSSTGDLVALTNNHVAGLAYDPAYLQPTWGRLSAVGEDFMQPPLVMGGVDPDDVIGSVLVCPRIRFGTDTDTPANIIDAAIISIDDIDVPWFSVNTIHAGPFPFGDAYHGLAVKKSGAATGVTSGTVTATNAAINVLYNDVIQPENYAKFVNQIEVTGTGTIVAGGDSGSIVFGIFDGVITIIGLLTSGSDDTFYANHIDDVASFLGIEAWNGSIVIPRSLDAAATVNSTLFRRSGDTTRAVTHTED